MMARLNHDEAPVPDVPAARPFHATALAQGRAEFGP